VNDDAGTVNYRLNPSRTKSFNLPPDKSDYRGVVRDFSAAADLGQLTADKIDNQWSRKIGLSRTGGFA
jgi:hypothetical protein